MKVVGSAAQEPAEDRFSGLVVSELKEVEKQSVVSLALQVLAEKHTAGRPLLNTVETREYLRLRLANRKNEVFGSLFLDARNRIIAVQELFHGTVGGITIYARVVVQQALELNAAAVVLFHNHPSGVAEPSYADRRTTRQLVSALDLMDVRVLDHLVVTAESSVSFAERGLL